MPLLYDGDAFPAGICVYNHLTRRSPFPALSDLGGALVAVLTRIYSSLFFPSILGSNDQMTEVPDLGVVLHAMGEAAEEVAATLRSAGIQGVRNTVRFLNPIVRYCQSRILLDNYELDVMQPGVLRIKAQGENRYSPLPQAVVDFLKAFDHGAYPDLELPA